MKNDPDAFIAKLADASAAERRAAAAALGEHAKNGSKIERALAPLAKLLDDRDGEVRLAASTALGWLAFKANLIHEPSLDALIRHLDDDVAMVRHDAAWILETFVKRGIIDPRAVAGLAKNLGHESADVRAASIYCLGLFAKEGAVPPDVIHAIEKLGLDPESGVRDAVKTALAVASVKTRKTKKSKR